MQQAPFVITLEIKKDQLDALYHHLHHARIMEYLEVARLEFLKAIGWSSDSLIASGLFPVISKITISYLREVRAGNIQVTCQEREVTGRRLIIKQRAVDGKGKLLVEALVESMLLNSVTKRAIFIDDPLKTAFITGVTPG